ncbi:cyclic nucleotide-binding domain-containing protein [Phthorimaea operculella]|nr:cyclic nucleotide-binding domain-containing protein [Phthorimaea operculella]
MKSEVRNLLRRRQPHYHCATSAAKSWEDPASLNFKQSLIFFYSLFWRTFMLFMNFFYVLIAPMRFCYVLPKPVPSHSPFDYILLTLKAVCFLDIIMRLNTGYKDKKEVHIVLDRRRIVIHYLTHWFLIDVLTSFPFGFLVPLVNASYKTQMYLRMVCLLRCSKVFTIINDLRLFLRLFDMDLMNRRLLRLCIAFTISLQWCSCMVYMACIINFYKTGKSPKGYCRFLVQTEGDLTRSGIVYRFKKATFIAFAAFFGTAFRTFRAVHPDEMITNAVVIVYGQLFMMFTMANMLKMYITKFNITMRYQELMNQVEKYMKQKQFPAAMKSRVREFYKYRYQERYFRESLAMASLSEQLRNEITLDTCHKLIEKVSLFEGLPPSVVGSVLGCLHPEVYLPNDLVTRAGDVGDCMYFIACGTVAVYSMKGAEVCHLDDGAHFGEVALLMKDHKRIATVIAIEITQVYRLDQSDFQDFIMSYEELYVRIEKMASKRMHETTLIDDPYKQKNSF